MKERYPNYEIILDIGSSLNFKRTRLMKIIKYALYKELNLHNLFYKD